MILQIALLVLGFVVLIKGADWLIQGVSVLARKYQVSDLAIGLTVVAFGTSAPELVVNSFASYQGQDDIVFGNVIGSSIFNVFMILGLVGLISPPQVQSSTVWKEIPLSFISIVLLWLMTNIPLFGLNHTLQRWDGILLLVFFVGFLYYVYKQLKHDPEAISGPVEMTSNWYMWGLILVGMACLFLGGRLVVNNAILLATTFGMDERVIGLTIVAAGTSLPEAAASMVAAFRKNNDIAVGNIVGSNIFNIFFILGVSALIHPVEFHTIFNRDIYFLGAGTALLFIAMFTGKRKKLDSWEASLFLTAFIIYTAYLIFYE